MKTDLVESGQPPAADKPIDGTVLPPVRDAHRIDVRHEPAPPAAMRGPAAPARRLGRALLVLLALGGAGAGALAWWHFSQPKLPPGIAVANGRIEAEEIDISTKFAGRVAELRVNEGDAVTAGQVVARMDTRDLEASLAKAVSQEQAAERTIAEAEAAYDQQSAQVALASSEYQRTAALVGRGFATRELFDQRRQALDAAKAGQIAAAARVDEAKRTREAAKHEIEYLKVNIADNTLVAPRMGRIQYRIANVGEVLAAGGKVFTMLDISDVYMDVFLPTDQAGRARFGSEGRIVLDAYPDRPIPSFVSFIATQAQFTPKAVETKTERDKLMFRIKLRIDPALLAAHAADVRSGLPGVGYVKLDPSVAWPDALRGKR